LQEFNEEIAQMDEAEIENHLRRAREYNDALYGGHIRDPFAEDTGMMSSDYYLKTLNISGIMAQIEIPIIGVHLPVLHMIDKEVLNRGVGHVPGTSFPVGGMNTHAILTGHSGLPNARMFTDLEELSIGDQFFITVLNETLAYQVDQIMVVFPHEIEFLRVERGADFVTLITCTPYAVNTHRLLVRGARIPYEVGMADETALMSGTTNWRLVNGVAIGHVLLLTLIFYLVGIGRSKLKREDTQV